MPQGQGLEGPGGIQGLDDSYHISETWRQLRSSHASQLRHGEPEPEPESQIQHLPVRIEMSTADGHTRLAHLPPLCQEGVNSFR